MPYKYSYYPKLIAYGRLSGSLCSGCANSVPSQRLGHGCEWSTKFQPVPGWVATETTILCGCAAPTLSYCVHECPKFVQDCQNEDLQLMGIGFEEVV